jgi:DHA3 family macrolide efflux protein-like MFS transporter
MAAQTTSPAQPARWAPRFFTIWTGQAFSLLGSQLVQFALVWWITKTTGSATMLAMATLVALLPQIVLGPLAGTLVDRWNRRLTMIIADSIIALATIVLAVLFALGQAQVWHVYLMMFVRSAAGGFHWPAMAASTSLMVPKQHLARVQGLNQMLYGLLSIVAAPFGALLMEWLPMQGILAIDVVTAALAITPLFFLSVPQPEPSAEQAANGKTSIGQDFRAGLRYVWSWPGLLIITLMASVINFLLNPAFALLPILVTKHFNGQVYQYAALDSVTGIGMIAGGLLLSAWGGFKRRVVTSLVGLVGMGLGCLVMGVLPPSAFLAAVGAMLFLGIANPITNGPMLASVQAVVAPDMQGRVFSLINSMCSAMSPLGLFIAGPLADKFGPQSWFLIGGVVTGLMGITAFFIPAVMNFEQGRGGQPAGDQAPVAAASLDPEYT